MTEANTAALPNDLENEILLKRSRYEKLTKNNEAIVLSISEKEKKITQYRAYMKDLRDQHAGVIHQCELEFTHSKQNYDFQLSMLEESARGNELKQRRRREVENETKELQSALDNMREALGRESMEHGNWLHTMNVNMKVNRKKLESSLSKELASLDIANQHTAFKNLSDRQKEAMLVNDNLKDEVSIQGFGIHNLSQRLSKQVAALVEAKEDIEQLDQNAKNLRNRLGRMRVVDKAEMNEIEEIESAASKLNKERERLEVILNQGPSIGDIEIEIKAAADTVAFEMSLADLWRTRLEQLENIKSFLRPLSLAESAGVFDRDVFKVAQVRTPDIGNRKKNDEGIKEIKEIVAEISRDKYLTKMFKGMCGRESILLSSTTAQPSAASQYVSQNVTKWLTCEIMKVWRDTRALITKKSEEKFYATATLENMSYESTSSVPMVESNEDDFAFYHDDAVNEDFEALWNEVSNRDSAPPLQQHPHIVDLDNGRVTTDTSRVSLGIPHSESTSPKPWFRSLKAPLKFPVPVVADDDHGTPGFDLIPPLVTIAVNQDDSTSLSFRPGGVQSEHLCRKQMSSLAESMVSSWKPDERIARDPLAPLSTKRKLQKQWRRLKPGMHASLLKLPQLDTISYRKMSIASGQPSTVKSSNFSSMLLSSFIQR